jgi:apolipoprotein N-acyltransferase
VFPILEIPFIRFFLLPFIGGLLYASGFPMSGGSTFFLGPFIGLCLLFHNLSAETQYYKGFSVELGSVLAFSLGHYLLGYYWIPYTIKEFGQVPFPFNHSLGLFFSLIVLPQFLVFVGLNALLKKFKLNSLPFTKSSSQRHLFYALCLTMLEYLVPQQFPGHFGHPWLVFAPYLGLAPLFGVPLFSFMSYLIMFQILKLIKTKSLDGFICALLAVFIIGNFAFPIKYKSNPDNTLNVRMVQANIGNFLKVSSESGDFQALNQVLQQFFEMSIRPSDQPLDLIIWPETAYPRLLSSQMMKTSSLYAPRLAQETIQASRSELFIGGYDQIAQSFVPSNFFETEYNSAFHFNQNGVLKNVYHKRVLIPFGESLPFGPFNRFLSSYISNISYFAKGENYTLFQTQNQIPFISVICYEILFSNFVRDFLNSLDRHPLFMINLTNDSWYGDTAEPYQHLFLAKWRALEFNLPILRMTNTGITSVLYPDGSESERLMPFTQENLDVKLELPNRQSTLFETLGVWGTLALALLLLILAWAWEKSLRWLKNPL